MPSNAAQKSSPSSSTPKFSGFALPTSNTTYTPNQFFDVCLPHYSRGCVRLVALLLRQTLGWCDEEGKPQVIHHLAFWHTFQEAGISRQMIRSSLQEAIDGHFIRCVRQPVQQRAGQGAVSGVYELKWDERPTYIKDPAKFRGFFAGEGNRTYIPNQFFDHVIPNESLAVVKVVGSVIRFSIGFQNKWGHRRQKIALSYQHIQNYARMKDRNTLSKALQNAMHSNYIERVERGYFDPNGGKLSKTAVYALKWLRPLVNFANGQKTLPAENDPEKRSEIPTGNGLKTLPESRSEIPTDIEIKQRNKILKQQRSLAAEAAASIEILEEAGFDTRAAKTIAFANPFDRIERQIQWIDQRKATKNRLGMLRKAIMEDWPAPSAKKLGQPNLAAPRGDTFGEALSRIDKRLNEKS